MTLTSSAPLVLDPATLTEMDPREFARLTGSINTAYIEAQVAYDLAVSNLTALLTEQIARRVEASHPSATLLFVRAVAEYHYTPEGEVAEGCEGHDERLAPVEALDAHGNVVVEFDDLHPANFLLERLSPMLGVEDWVLDIPAREWALDCSGH